VQHDKAAETKRIEATGQQSCAKRETPPGRTWRRLKKEQTMHAHRKFLVLIVVILGLRVKLIVYR
jgi:hypothetical protein